MFKKSKFNEYEDAVNTKGSTLFKDNMLDYFSAQKEGVSFRFTFEQTREQIERKKNIINRLNLAGSSWYDTKFLINHFKNMIKKALKL
jgi:hypothetical protein